MENDLLSSSEVQGGGEVLRGFWYPALLSARVAKSGMRQAMLLGEPLAIGRDAQGKPFAMRDACPHRGMPLSCGRLEGDLLECAYHGWRFHVHSGQCREIPSWVAGDKLKVDRIFAAQFPCEDQDGYVWVFIPDSAKRGEPVPPAPRLPVFSPRYRITHLSADLPVNVDQGIIGLMDPAHGPFVHQAWWWRTRHSIQQKEKVFEPIPNGFRIRAHKPSANSGAYRLLGVYGQPITTTIEFVLPNMRFEQIHCGDKWFSSRATVTPIDAQSCRIDFCAAWNVFLRVPFMVSIFRSFARTFIGQDQRTMRMQAEGLKYHPRLMLIDDADRPAKWYFELKQAHLEAKRTGQPMKHPIDGSVTLRWKS
ncbi:MAG TPA: aromatic ring-hydroxylating dioxygenase subunit alpha [Terriglobia bacterium]|nr:aromatic ring-hydroxylating dioxygenase subunit alpha [Terriglobia bacterium]